jgi:hypothetical protein
MYINWKRKELVITIALYGPEGSGKTTTWEHVKRYVSPEDVDGDTVRVRLENVQGKRLILNLRDTDGDVEAASQRRVSLYGVDGVVFVADSALERQKYNSHSLYELESYLEAMQKNIYSMPFLFQYNKRDLAGSVPVEELQARLNPDGIFFHHNTSALGGDGVKDVMQTITDLILTTVLY